LVDMYIIECCRNCPNSLLDLEYVAALVKEVFDAADFNLRQRERLQTDRPLHHQIFRVGIAGCPNSCSQPQIKDFGIQGQLIPQSAEGCVFCGKCVLACPDGAITMTDSGPDINRNMCLNCGICIRKCPSGALRAAGTGFRLLAGGKLGRRPRLATPEPDIADEYQVKEYLSQKLELLLQEGKPGERLGQLLEKINGA